MLLFLKVKYSCIFIIVVHIHKLLSVVKLPYTWSNNRTFDVVNKEKILSIKKF